MISHSAKRSSISQIIPILCTCVIISVILLIPLKIMGYGFLPLDDVLRHVAKAMSGRSWSDILVLREGVTLDSHPGYHAVLSAIYNSTGWSSDTIVCVAIMTLFFVFCLIPVLSMKRPEAWLAALFAASLVNFPFIMRLFFGRPYMMTTIAIIAIFLLWGRLKDDKSSYKTAIIITALVALSTWMHCSWYLFILPIAAFLMARQWRAAAAISMCIAVGVVLGAVFTGHPVLFIKQNAVHAFLVFSNHVLPKTLAMELRPFTGDVLSVFAVILMLLWIRSRGEWERKKIDNPAFIFAFTGWVLGFFVIRFWLDFGLPVLLVWAALEFEETLERRVPADSLKRLFITALIAMILFLNMTNDSNERWSNNPSAEYLDVIEHDKSFLPEPGGIVYSDDMKAFFVTFFKYPHAPWRYLVGFEPSLMPQEDLIVFMNIQMSGANTAAFYPWIKKMKPADRLIVTSKPDKEPAIPQLEWGYYGSGFWIGRLRKMQ